MSIKLSNQTIEIDFKKLTPEDKEKLRAELEETKSWPQKGGRYWYVEAGSATVQPSSYDEDDIDAYRTGVGNFFLTAKAAEEHIEYLKALQILRGDTKGYEYKVGDRYYIGGYNRDEATLRSSYWSNTVSPGIKFKTVDDILASFELHKKEWLIVLGVE